MTYSVPVMDAARGETRNDPFRDVAIPGSFFDALKALNDAGVECH